MNREPQSYNRLRWTALAVTFALFGAVQLVVTLLTPVQQRGLALIPPVVAAVLVVALLPFVFGAFERQNERIENQRRELDTLHAMDTAILRELDLPKLLEVVLQRTLRALDAEAGGIVLLKEDGSVVESEVFDAPDRSDGDLSHFQAVVRSGGRPNVDWETVVLPLGEVGGPVGYLGAGRFRPCRPFTAGDNGILAALTDTVSVAIANARTLEKARTVALVEADLERERQVAIALTEGLLPEIPPRIGQWAFSVRYEPQSKEAPVGGDIYDLFELGEGRWGVVIADVSGKGLKAARKTAMVKYCLRSYAREHTSPAEVLGRLNDALFDEPYLTEFVTLIYGVLDDSDGSFTYASAGHEPPLLRRISGPMETLPPTGVVLGAIRDMFYTDGAITLGTGDGLLLYTDGFSESRSKEDEIFLDTDGIADMVEQRRNITPECMADSLLEGLRAYTGGRSLDDTALLWIQRVA